MPRYDSNAIAASNVSDFSINLVKLGYSLIIQLAPYAFSAAHVIWVVGTHKNVANLDEAMERLEKHTLKLEGARDRKSVV